MSRLPSLTLAVLLGSVALARADEAARAPEPGTKGAATTEGTKTPPAVASDDASVKKNSGGDSATTTPAATGNSPAANASGANSGPVAAPADLGEVVEQGRAWLEETFPDTDFSQLAEIDQTQLLELLRPLARAFEEGEFDDLAGVREHAAEVLAWLRSQPWGKPYADWLAPRMDYLDIAAEAEVTAQQQWAQEQQQPRNNPAPSVAPAQSPTLRFQVVRDRVHRSVQSKSVWAKRVAQHAPPARAGELAPPLREIFRAEGVPPEMVWLAEVESSFDPEARSPVGARGLFQFMPATAQRFGLKTFPFDERTDPAKSAKAAAQYLRALHGRFRDWPLVLAAYNAGEGRVGRALDASKTRSFDAIASSLPAETRLYVPKVMATVAAREGVDPFALPAPWDPAKAPAAPALAPAPAPSPAAAPPPVAALAR